MGGNQAHISQAQFKKNWRKSDNIQNLNLWTNRHNPSQHLEEYLVRQGDSRYSDQLNAVRRESHYLVNAYEIGSSEGGIQCGPQSRRLLIEKIPVRLSNVRDVPYPDCLHLYDSTLNGYEQLANIVGCFSIDEEQIGISDRGQVKVWLNPAFEQNNCTGVKIGQKDMVLELLEVLNLAVDRDDFANKNVPYLHEYLLRSEYPINFHNIKARFNNYVRQYNNSDIPLQLNCVNQTGGIHYIDSWCRSNQSYGYEASNLRKSEQLYQTKMAKASSYRQSLKFNPQYSQKVNNSTIVRERQSYVNSQPINQHNKEQAYTSLIKQNMVFNRPQTGPITYQLNPLPLSLQQSRLNRDERIVTTVKLQPNSTVLIAPEPNVSQTLRSQQSTFVRVPSVTQIQQYPLQTSQINSTFQPAQMIQQRRIQINQSVVVDRSFNQGQIINVNRPIYIPNLANSSPVVRNIPQPQQQQQILQNQQVLIRVPSNRPPLQTETNINKNTQIQFQQQPPQVNQIQQIKHILPLQGQPGQVQIQQVQQVQQLQTVQRVHQIQNQPQPEAHQFQPQNRQQNQQQHANVFNQNPNPAIASSNPIYQKKQITLSNSNQNQSKSFQNSNNYVRTNEIWNNEKALQQIYNNPDFRANQSSKLQQHRVISQAIEIKESPITTQHVITRNYYNAPYHPNIIQQENSPSKKDNQDAVYYNNYNYSRFAPSSQDIIPPKYQSYTVDDDDKPSPEFLALMNDLRINKGANTQYYESIGNTPISYAKQGNSYNHLDYLKEANAYETYSQEASWSQDRGNKKVFQTEQKVDYEADIKGTSQPKSNFEQTYKYSGNYNTSKYQLSIDDDLLADLNKYK